MRAPFGLHLFWMTFRQSWKGFVLFLLILMFITWGMASVLPAFLDMQQDDYSEAQGIRLEWADEDAGVLNLTWYVVPGAANYTLLENNQTFDISSIISLLGGDVANLSIHVAYDGPGTSLLRAVDTNQTWWYTVIVTLQDGNHTGTGVVSTKDIGKTIYEVMMEQPGYSAMTGGREINIFTVAGFIDIELLSYWAILVGFYAAYVGVGAVSRDVERKSMDLLLSTPVSRRRMLLERGAAIGTMMLMLSVAAGLGAVAGASATGLEVPVGDIMAGFVGVWPLLLLIVALSMMLSVLLNDQKSAMGLSFAVVLMSYVLNYASFLSDGLRNLRWVSPMGYYDHTGLIIGDWDRWGDVGVLVGATAVVAVIALWLFDRKELPT